LFKGAITWADERINDNDIEYELRQDANSDNGKLSIPDVSCSVCYSSACSNNEDNKCKHGDYDCSARQTMKRTYHT